MKLKVWALYTKSKKLLIQDDGQDLIEYALVVALIAFAAVGGMSTLAGQINNAFIGIGNTLTSSI
jgi:pilus assembly protein Flp/PilA